MEWTAKELRMSLAAWLRWHAASRKEIEAALPVCRPILEAMSKVSGVLPLVRLAQEIDDYDPETAIRLDHEKRRLRVIAQTLIKEIGASGPMNAEDVAEKAVQVIRDLREENLKLLAEIEEWKTASGLERGGDPDGVTPDDLRAEIKRLDMLVATTSSMFTDVIDNKNKLIDDLRSQLTKND